MGRRKGLIFIALGATLAAVVGIVVYMLAQTATSAEIEMNDVVVALQDIPDRSIIQAGAVGIKAMPVDVVPNGSFVKIEDVIGKMAPYKIFAGEIVLSDKIMDTKGQTGLAFLMGKGKVLMTFPASNIVGLGLVKPGDSVDVLVTYRPSKGGGSQSSAGNVDPELANVTQATLQNLAIVTVGSQQSSSPQASAQSQPAQQAAQPTSVTFAIEPQDALTLKALKDAEDLSIEIVLRAAGDSEQYTTEPTTLRSVLERYNVRSDQ